MPTSVRVRMRIPAADTPGKLPMADWNLQLLAIRQDDFVIWNNRNISTVQEPDLQGRNPAQVIDFKLRRGDCSYGEGNVRHFDHKYWTLCRFDSFARQCGLRGHYGRLPAINSKRFVQYEESQTRENDAKEGKKDGCNGGDSRPIKLAGFILAPLSLFGLIVGLKLLPKGGELAHQFRRRRANLFGNIGLAISPRGPLFFFLFVL